MTYSEKVGSMNELWVSIIIPAHNEEKMIGDCLEQLLKPSGMLNLEIIVICNGCDDNTVSIVNTFSKNRDEVLCIETEVASKTNALNLGDNVALYFPRIYLDADIKISIDDILKVALVMGEGALAAAPKMQMDLTESSWAVKSYYDIWCDLPYCREGMIGAGVYVLSKKGRGCFAEFPDMIADDRYIRALFNSEQRILVPSAISIVRAPASLCGLIKIKTRSRLGGYEFECRFPELIGNETKQYSSAIKNLIFRINLWPKLFIYLSVNIFTRIRARIQSKTIGFSHWERDESSRNKVRGNDDK